MKVVHIPNSHYYHKSLIHALKFAGIEVDTRTWGWGAYLPDAIDDLLRTEADIFHLHWPEALCRQPAHGLLSKVIRRTYLHATRQQEELGRWILETASALDRLQAGGRKLVWTMHNRTPHSTRGQERTAYNILYREFAWRADGVIHHSRWGEQAARTAYLFDPRCRHAIIHFGYFPDEAAPSMTKRSVRQEMGISEHEMVLLTVGAVGPRKQLDLIADALGATMDITCRLFVAGHVDQTAQQNLLERSKGRIHFAGSLDQAGLSRLARVADYLIFAPKTDALTTGGPHVSESFLLPQITTPNDYAKEVLGQDALYYEPTVIALRAALHFAHRVLVSQPEAYREMVCALERKRKGHDWSAAAEKTAAFYRVVLNRSEDRASL